MTAVIAARRGCALAGCSRRATTTIHACGTVHVCEPCRNLIEDLAADGELEAVTPDSGTAGGAL
ncbi:hypothetical protein [Streptosporangium sp. NPDC002607]